jgi:hypothetical protein
VQRAIRSGRIDAALVDGPHGRAKIDVDLADQLWRANTQPTLQREQPARKARDAAGAKRVNGRDRDTGQEEAGRVARLNINEASAAKLAAQAQIAELEVQKLLGKTLARDEVELEAARIATIIRDGLLALPDRLAGLVAAETEESVVRALMREEVVKLLEELVGDVGGE